MQRGKTRSKHVDRFQSSPGIGKECIFPDRPAHEYFGDPAYPLRIHLQAPFRHGVLTPMREQYNFDMCSVRVTVEWLFGDIMHQRLQVSAWILRKTLKLE